MYVPITTCTMCLSGAEDWENDRQYTIKFRCCLPPNTPTLNLTCADSYGDGWNGGYVEINGIQYCTDFPNDHKEITEIVTTASISSFSQIYDFVGIFDFCSILLENRVS